MLTAIRLSRPGLVLHQYRCTQDGASRVELNQPPGSTFAAEKAKTPVLGPPRLLDRRILKYLGTKDFVPPHEYRVQSNLAPPPPTYNATGIAEFSVGRSRAVVLPRLALRGRWAEVVQHNTECMPINASLFLCPSLPLPPPSPAPSKSQYTLLYQADLLTASVCVV